eukprot:11254639-Karenia_brevis.AAC.1
MPVGVPTSDREMATNACMGLVPYWDPKLKINKFVYRDFISQMHKRGLVFFSLSRTAPAGCFFVRKKDGRLRLIVDGRPGNAMLQPPKS